MGRVLTNNVSLQYAVESTELAGGAVGLLVGETGAPAGTPEWYALEPNEYGDIGATITKIPRNPISNTRQRRKGAISDLDSQANYGADLIFSHLRYFAEAYFFSTFDGAIQFQPTATDADSYTVNDLSVVLDENTLIYSRGFVGATNNGLKVVDVGSTSTDIVVKGGGMTVETPVGNASVEVAGFRSAAGDLAVSAVTATSEGTQVTITSAANIFNSTALNLVPGQFICFAEGSAALNKFTTATNIGYAKIVSVDSGGANIVIDETKDLWVVEVAAAQEVEFFVGTYSRNVKTDDPLFLERSVQFEIGLPNLDNNPSGDMYEYSKGNYAGTLDIAMVLSDKVTLSFGFIGTDTDNPTSTRKAGASAPLLPLMTEAFSTTSDCIRMRITKVDETGITTDFKSLTLKINNNVSPEKVLCNLGARFMNYGNFEIDGEGELLFTDAAVPAAIRGNETVAMTFGARNEDGAYMFHIPSMTMGGGNRSYPINQSVTVNITGEAYADSVLDISLGLTMFPYIPVV